MASMEKKPVAKKGTAGKGKKSKRKAVGRMAKRTTFSGFQKDDLVCWREDGGDDELPAVIQTVHEATADILVCLSGKIRKGVPTSHLTVKKRPGKCGDDAGCK